MQRAYSGDLLGRLFQGFDLVRTIRRPGVFALPDGIVIPVHLTGVLLDTDGAWLMSHYPVSTMPLRVWRRDTVTPVTPHPNDPGS